MAQGRRIRTVHSLVGRRAARLRHQSQDFHFLYENDQPIQRGDRAPCPDIIQSQVAIIFKIVTIVIEQQIGAYERSEGRSPERRETTARSGCYTA